MNAWRRARLPLREGRKRLPVDRQLQLIAGAMVLTGVGLGLRGRPWFLALAAFFGAGLTFAGVTGTCGLALLLMKCAGTRPGRAPAERRGGVRGGAAQRPPAPRRPRPGRDVTMKRASPRSRGRRLELIAQRFRALSDPTRLALLQAMFEGEQPVQDLCAITGASQAN